MKEIVLNYTQYNVWANKAIIEIVNSLPNEDVEKELVGSFPSVRKTIAHIAFAESIWIQRLQMAEHIIIPNDDDHKPFAELCNEWLGYSNELLAFTDKIKDERGLQHEFHYTNIKGELFKSKVWECLQHVCNHSTFHRGQLITYCRQLGITKIPSTDFITFCRIK